MDIERERLRVGERENEKVFSVRILKGEQCGLHDALFTAFCIGDLCFRLHPVDIDPPGPKNIEGLLRLLLYRLRLTSVGSEGP